MMATGTEIKIGGDGDDDFSYLYMTIEHSCFFPFYFTPFLNPPFFQFSYIFPIKRHDTALTRMRMRMRLTMVYECALPRPPPLTFLDFKANRKTIPYEYHA